MRFSSTDKHGLLFFFLLAITMNFISCSSSRPVMSSSKIQAFQNQAITRLQDTTIIMVGDSVLFSVWGEPEFTTRAAVRSTGTISVPLIGDNKAAGQSKKELELLLQKRLAEIIQGEIKLTLEIISPPPQIIFLGAVGRQGGFPARDKIGLLEALSSAGGWTEEADLSHILITRQKTQHDYRKYITVDLAEYLEDGMVQELPYLFPGDVVLVPIQENLVRSVSEFLRDALILFGVFGLVR
jgi:polysaccharide export outer membrane protein